jgi:hypothetical protein
VLSDKNTVLPVIFIKKVSKNVDGYQSSGYVMSEIYEKD